MSRAMQKYAEQRGINLEQASEEGAGRVQGAQEQMLGDTAEEATDDAVIQRQQGLDEDGTGIGMGGGMALGKVGSMLRDAVTKGSKVLSAADKAAARASKLARATGNESVADGIDGARAATKAAASRVGDTVDGLEDGVRGVTDVSRSGLTSMVDNASNVSKDLVSLAPKSTDIASGIQSTVSNNSRQVMGNTEQTLSTADGPVQDTRGFFRKLLTKAPQEEELEDESEKLAQKALGQTFTDSDIKNLASNQELDTLNPSLAAPDQALANQGRSIEDVAKSFSSQTADDLVAGGTDAGRLARGVGLTSDLSKASRSTNLLGGLSGDSTLARATATPMGSSAAGENPFSFKNFGVTEDDLGGPVRTSKFGDVLQTQPEEVAPPLEGTGITSRAGAVQFQPRAQPSAQTDIDPTAGPSGGQASSSNLGRNGGLTEEERLNKANSTQQDSDLTNDLDADGNKLNKLNTDDAPEIPGMKSGVSNDLEETLSMGDKFMKYGGAALEGVGFAGALAGIGFGIYDMMEGPSLKTVEKQKDKIMADEMSGATSKPISYGSVAGATMNTMPDASAGTFQHF